MIDIPTDSVGQVLAVGMPVAHVTRQGSHTQIKARMVTALQKRKRSTLQQAVALEQRKRNSWDDEEVWMLQMDDSGRWAEVYNVVRVTMEARV